MLTIPGRWTRGIGAAVVALSLAISACDDAPGERATPPAPPAEAAKSIADDIVRKLALPSDYLQAGSVDRRLGDGVLGPSDVRSFTAIRWRPGSLDGWSTVAPRLARAPGYASPDGGTDWIAPGDFDNLEFYAASPILGFRQGWIGVSRRAARIYVFTLSS